MQISKEWLQARGACFSVMEFVEEKQLLGLKGEEFVRTLMEEDICKVQ